MSDDKEVMCKLKKILLKEDINGYIFYLDDPRYLCRKCGRVANNKVNLCKPLDLKKN